MELKLLSRAILFAATISLCTSNATGQSNDVEEAAQAPNVVELPQTTFWKFGLRITATGQTNGIIATVPIPIDWPEQTLEIISKDQSDPVTSVRAKNLRSANAQQLEIRVNRLAAGEIAEAYYTMKIVKHRSEPPEETGRFAFAEKFPNDVRKFTFPSPYIESDHKTITELAAALPVDENAPPWDQVRTIYDWVRENIRYEFDEEIRTCLFALEAQQGDCEEMSSLFIALCRARGIPARAVWIPLHTYPEFFLVDENGEGHWFPCQVAGSEAFGYMPEAKPILQKGDKFRVRGQSEPLRYIQPTLTARHADSDPKVEWIMSQVEDPK